MEEQEFSAQAEAWISQFAEKFPGDPAIGEVIANAEAIRELELLEAPGYVLESAFAEAHDSAVQFGLEV